jgi:hypothetical protein
MVEKEAQLISLFLVITPGITQQMLTEAGRDLVASPVFPRLVARVDQVERAKLAGQILIVHHWVDYRVLREVAALREREANS